MSFEPKYIPAEPAPLDADGELILDASLKELAERLGQDAQTVDRLRRAAPETGAPRPLRPADRRRSWLRWLPWAAASLAAIAVATTSLPTGETPPASHPLTRSASPASKSPPFGADEPLFHPVELQPWTHMSEPELEGFLDLQPRPDAGISI